MWHRNSGLISCGLLLASSVYFPSPTLAHNIQAAGDVAATFHIEPNHNPQAGKRSTAWFALTRRGGRPISLSECDCRLSVYALPRSRNPKPVLQPALKAINIERYRGIPAADIIFPKVGLYDLVLTGKRKGGAEFRPFQFTYSVTVR